MNTALLELQSSLFDGLKNEAEEEISAGLVFEAQPNGTLRAEIQRAECENTPDKVDADSMSGDAEVLDVVSDASKAPRVRGLARQHQVAQASKPEVVEPASEATVQSQMPGFTAMWREYRATILDCASRIRAVKVQRFGTLNVGSCLGSEFNDHYMLRETQSRIISQVYTLAEKTFAPEGSTLKIERSLLEFGDDDAFDPDRLWAQLEAEYGGEAGVELAHKQLAAVLVDKFGLKRREPVRKQNRLVIEQSTYAEKRFSGGWEYSYSTIEWIRQAHNALVEFCRWAEDHETSMRIESGLRNFKSFEKLESRDRKDYGAVHTVSFKERMQYELYGDLGDKFHEFVALYGAEALEEKH